MHKRLVGEIHRGYSVISNRVQVIIDRLLQHGASAKWDDYKPADPARDGMNGIGANCFVTDSAIPVFAACMLGCEPHVVGGIALRCELDIHKLSEYFDLRNPSVVFSAQRAGDVDGVEFTKRVARGLAAAYNNDPDFFPAMKKLMSKRMIFALGFMDLGLEGLDMKAILDDDIGYLRGFSDPGFIDFEHIGFGEALNGMFDSISKLEHLPAAVRKNFFNAHVPCTQSLCGSRSGRGFGSRSCIANLTLTTLYSIPSCESSLKIILRRPHAS